jgi:glycosyltransferase involved in cell wall biosynthesis
MKIIYFHQYFNTPDMNGSTRSYEFAKGLIKMGHEVEMITTSPYPHKNNEWFKTKDSGISIHWLPLKYSNYMKFLERLKVFIIFAWKSYFRAIKIKGDIIFASSTPLTISIPAICISKKKNIPMVFEVRDLWPTVPIAMKILKNPILIYLSRVLEAWSYNNSNSIIALSPEIKKAIILRDVDPKKIAVIPNSSDLKKFEFSEKLAFNFRQKRHWLKNRPLLVYAGAFGKVNDLSYVIKLAKALIKQNPEIRILLIGDGLEKRKLIEDAKKNDVYKQNLFFEKSLPKKDMRECLSAANMTANFVIDIRENWANSANKFFDSLAAGKPIFLNHGGWLKDLVLNYGCGLSMHGKKIKVVAKELDIAISNDNWLKFSGDNAKNLAIKFFNRDEHIKQLEKILTFTKNNKSICDIAKGIYN